MKFSEIVKLWEDGYRGKFKDDKKGVFKCTEDGIQWDDEEMTCCDSGMLKDDAYELIKEPKKVTFEEAFTNPEYAGKNMYPENDTLIKTGRTQWFYQFYKNYYLFGSAIKSMWIIEEI